MGHMFVTITVHREGRHYVALCRELGTSSFGATEDETVQNAAEATALYLNTYQELGECERMLREKGLALRTSM